HTWVRPSDCGMWRACTCCVRSQISRQGIWPGVLTGHCWPVVGTNRSGCGIWNRIVVEQCYMGIVPKYIVWPSPLIVGNCSVTVQMAYFDCGTCRGESVCASLMLTSFPSLLWIGVPLVLIWSVVGMTCA